MPARLPTAEFIVKVKALHLHAGYNFDKFIYVNGRTKGTVTCSVPGHGDFMQRADHLLQGVGCPSCGGKVRLTTVEFIAKAKALYPGAGYSYDKVVYVNSHTRVTITCLVPSHGDFEQTPNNHLNGQGCPTCGRERTTASQTWTRDEFITAAKVRHPQACYNYDEFDYVDARTKGVITCSVPGHGSFVQTPDKHLQGQGCKSCGLARVSALRRSTREDFILKAKQRHPLAGYNYDQVVYVNTATKVTITCPIFSHGDFLQNPSDHLAGNGCQKCAGHISRVCTAWLDDLGITVREFPIPIPHRRNPLRADGYDPETNTVYEFLGDRFHGNPSVYDSGDWFSKNATYGQKYERWMRKLADLHAAGYNVVTVWEQDFRAANPGRIYPHEPLRSHFLPCHSRSASRPPRPPRNSQSDLFG